MDRHDEYLTLMSLALDDEIAPAELGRLHAHLRVCPACAQAWEAWSVLDRRLAAAPVIVPPSDLTAKVMARVRRAALAKQHKGWLGWGAWAGAISLVTGLIFWGAAALLWFGGQLAAVGDVLLGWLVALWLLVRGLAAALASIGAPTLAGLMAVLSCVTCLLGFLWLWLLTRRGRLGRVSIAR